MSKNSPFSFASIPELNLSLDKSNSSLVTVNRDSELYPDEIGLLAENSLSLDVDGNGLIEANRDGLLIYGYLNVRNIPVPSLMNQLASNLADPNGDRTSGTAIKAFLDSYLSPNDATPPTITANLSNDTGISNSDRITNNATITGTVTDASKIVSLKAGFDDTLITDFVDVSSSLNSNGSFTLNQTTLATVAGGSLQEGDRTLRLIAEDQFGNISDELEYSFNYDRTLPTIEIINNPKSSLELQFSENVLKGRRTT